MTLVVFLLIYYILFAILYIVNIVISFKTGNKDAGYGWAAALMWLIVASVPLIRSLC